jgi:hypothetical protein
MLQRRGLGVTAETADALSIARFFSLDLSQATAFCICYVGKPSGAMIQYTVRRLSKKSAGGRIFIALLGHESEAVAPMTDITGIAGGIGEVVDFITDIAAEESRLHRTSEAALEPLGASAGV